MLKFDFNIDFSHIIHREINNNYAIWIKIFAFGKWQQHSTKEGMLRNIQDVKHFLKMNTYALLF